MKKNILFKQEKKIWWKIRKFDDKKLNEKVYQRSLLNMIFNKIFPKLINPINQI